MVCLRRRVEDTASDDFRGTVESLPDLNIVIDHLGCRREDTTPPYMMYRRVLALAQYHNTSMMACNRSGARGKMNLTMPCRCPGRISKMSTVELSV